MALGALLKLTIGFAENAVEGDAVRLTTTVTFWLTEGLATSNVLFFTFDVQSVQALISCENVFKKAPFDDDVSKVFCVLATAAVVSVNP